MSEPQMIYVAGQPAGLAVSLEDGWRFYPSTTVLDRLDRHRFDTLPALRAAVRQAWRPPRRV